VDNFEMDVTCEGREAFDAMVGVAMRQRGARGTAVAYAVHPSLGMVLLWHHEPGRPDEVRADGVAAPVVALPYPMDVAMLSAFVWGWLGTVERGREPDHDGSNGKGWRVYNEAWGHVGGNHRAIVAVQPAWAMYGK
jgi:hypothetical protein